MTAFCSFNKALFVAANVALLLASMTDGAAVHQAKAGCSFNLDLESPTYPPHLIDGDNKIVLPVLVNGQRTINLNEGQQVSVGCLGSTNNLVITGQQVNPAVCTATSKLSIAGVEYGYMELGCVRQNVEVLVEDGTTCANGPGTVVKIGFQAGSTFIPLYESCHDKVLASNYFTTNYIVGNSADADDKANTGPTFKQGGYYPGLDVNTLYTQAEQNKTIAQIVGSEELAVYYVNVSKSYYLARGHLAPDADFIDASSQDASYYFLNAAPQWQSFNNGNWRQLEAAVRAEAISRRINFTIYTGTFGVMTLADVNGQQQPIYLTFDQNGNGLIPAPKYYWKLIHETASNTATAVLGINNPHIGTVTPADIICPDVCSQVPWVDWTGVTDIPKGYTFCCTSAELRKAINFAPDLDLPLFV